MRSLAAAVLLVSSSGMYAADPQLLNLVMPDAKVLAGVNVTTAKASPLGQFLLARISASSGADAHLQKLISLTGFDPRTDLAEILAASAADPAHPGGLVLAKGTFNVTEISAAAAQSPNVQIQTYDSYPLIVSTNPKTQVSRGVAFINGTIAVSGSLDLVKAALDRGGSTSSTNSLTNTALTVQVTQLSGANDEWVASTVSPAQLAPAQAQAAGTQSTGQSSKAAGFAASLKNIQTFQGGIKFGANDVLTAQLGAADAQSATALANVVQFAVSLVTMNSQKDAAATELAQILQSLQVSASGTNLNLSSSIPDAQIQTLLSSLPAHKKAN
jgi:hypothetical protein